MGGSLTRPKEYFSMLHGVNETQQLDDLVAIADASKVEDAWLSAEKIFR